MPFCAGCGAPQIRVTGVDVSPPEQNTPEDLNPRESPAPTFHANPAIQWGLALRTTLTAGVIGAFLMVTPFGVFGLGMLIAGAVSVFLYRRRNPWANLTTGVGAKLGIASGFFGSIIFAWIVALLVLVFHGGEQLRAVIIQALDQSAARNPDPEAQQVFQYLKTPQGLATAAIFLALFMFVFFVALGGVGGAIGAMVARRKESS